jgi:hypothetical protein
MVNKIPPWVLKEKGGDRALLSMRDEITTIPRKFKEDYDISRKACSLVPFARVITWSFDFL